jgi:hypothetical protein
MNSDELIKELEWFALPRKVKFKDRNGELHDINYIDRLVEVDDDKVDITILLEETNEDNY